MVVLTAVVGHACHSSLRELFLIDSWAWARHETELKPLSVRDETIFTLTCVFGLNGPHLNRQTNGLHAMLIVGAGTRGGHKDD